MNTSSMHGKVLTVSMELAMNFATGFMLHQEREQGNEGENQVG